MYLVIVLILDWLLLFAYCIGATTCIYLKDKTLIKKNIINSKQTLDYVRAKFPNINFNVYQIQNIRSLKWSPVITVWDSVNGEAIF